MSRLGLVKKQVTDKHGVRRTVWVRPDQNVPETKSKKNSEELAAYEYKKWGDKGFTREDMEKYQADAAKGLTLHNETFQETKSTIEDIAKGATVKGRVKTADSAAYKVHVRDTINRFNGDVGNLTDATGFMVIRDSVQALNSDADKLKEKYTLVQEKDYNKKPQGDYRALHLILKDDNGKVFEVQLKTENQGKWAGWNHDIYKPMTAAQEQALADNGDVIKEYASKMSEYYAKVDQGIKGAQAPPCINVIEITFGCLD